MNEFVRKFLSHDAGPVAQFLKYAVVGGMATAVNIVAFFVFAWWVFPCITESDILVRLFHLTPPVVDEAVRGSRALASNVVAFVFADVFCYILNRIFVFKPGRLPIWLEFLSFTAVGGFATAVGSTVMVWLVNHFGMQTTLAFGANMVAALMFNYVLRKFFIFKG